MLVKRAACPRCTKNGKDTRQDNLAIYENGEFCFACKYSRKYDKPVPKSDEETASLFKWPTVKHLPPDWEEYLNVFEISANIRNRYFSYCPDLDRLVVSIEKFTEARSLYKEPKVLSWGTKPCEVFRTWPAPQSPLVFCEDIISTMMIGNVVGTACLFGSQWISNWDQFIKKYHYHPIFWLDKDKLNLAREYRDKWNALGISSTLIFTPKDPKYYRNYQIKEFVHKAIKSLNLKVDPVEESLVLKWNPIKSRMEKVPVNSYRAHYWFSDPPVFIPTESLINLPKGNVIRFIDQTLVYVLEDSQDAAFYSCAPTGFTLQTKHNNMDLFNEDIGITNDGIGLAPNPPPEQHVTYGNIQTGQQLQGQELNQASLEQSIKQIKNSYKQYKSPHSDSLFKVVKKKKASGQNT